MSHGVRKSGHEQMWSVLGIIDVVGDQQGSCWAGYDTLLWKSTLRRGSVVWMIRIIQVSYTCPEVFMQLVTNRDDFLVLLQSLNDARCFLGRHVCSDVERHSCGWNPLFCYTGHVSGWCRERNSPLCPARLSRFQTQWGCGRRDIKGMTLSIDVLLLWVSCFVCVYIGFLCAYCFFCVFRFLFFKCWVFCVFFQKSVSAFELCFVLNVCFVFPPTWSVLFFVCVCFVCLCVCVSFIFLCEFRFFFVLCVCVSRFFLCVRECVSFFWE